MNETKTLVDLRIEYRRDRGDVHVIDFKDNGYQIYTNEYVEWLEQKLLIYLNNGAESIC
jgi:hypothetical protein